MLEISLDLGNVPSILQALANERMAQDIVNAAAESYTDDTLDWIKAGRSFTTRTGQLEQSINWRPAGDGKAEIYANAEHAGYVEFGTRPKLIKPSWRNGLKLPSSSGHSLQSQAKRKGSRPFPYFYADMDNREQHMQNAGLLVLARLLNE